jgi:hypothetical protein
MTPGSAVDVSFVAVSDPGVPPVKDVIAPANDLTPLRAPSSRLSSRASVRRLRPLIEARGH